ncbi:LapA family protein [Pseudomonas mandelii]|nr:LapA family protein [Pseudomonas mandelii]
MLENEQSVIISVFGWSSSELPLSVCIVAALLIGMTIGPMLGYIVWRRHK